MGSVAIPERVLAALLAFVASPEGVLDALLAVIASPEGGNGASKVFIATFPFFLGTIRPVV